MEWITGLIGVLVGSGVTAGMAYLERQWRNQDVRAAEKRVRQEERFESVRLYAIGLQEFVHEAVALLDIRRRSTDDEDWRTSAQTVERDLSRRLTAAEALRPRPGPSYLLRDKTAVESLLVLELEAHGCHLKGLEHLAADQAMTDDMASGFVQGGDNALDKLLTRMDELVEQLEP